ncbi:hypothetical protein, partial [Heyndrickxia sporothermodurans]|uniref:hypothetical protein n=1 Tax=Heyndrickxia sporothermodurans TaxID=46224 RepID=UPI000D452CAF
MSWIKKLVNLFTVEVEDDEDVNIVQKKVNSNRNDTYRNIETRMKYEYQKGKFSFTSIHDEVRFNSKK